MRQRSHLAFITRINQCATRTHVNTSLCDHKALTANTLALSGVYLSIVTLVPEVTLGLAHSSYTRQWPSMSPGNPWLSLNFNCLDWHPLPLCFFNILDTFAAHLFTPLAPLDYMYDCYIPFAVRKKKGFYFWRMLNWRFSPTLSTSKLHPAATSFETEKSSDKSRTTSIRAASFAALFVWQQLFNFFFFSLEEMSLIGTFFSSSKKLGWNWKNITTTFFSLYNNDKISIIWRTLRNCNYPAKKVSVAKLPLMTLVALRRYARGNEYRK